MQKSLFTFNFNRAPKAFILALAAIFMLEIFLFSQAAILVDRSRVCDNYKLDLIRGGPDFDVVIFGASRTLALNAKMLENTSEKNISVYNFAVPDLGAVSEFYLSLEEYLKYNKKPKLIIISVVIEDFDVKFDGKLGKFPERVDGIPLELTFPDLKRFCSFFPLNLVLGNIPAYENIFLLKYYMQDIIPSIRYKGFIDNIFTLEFYVNKSHRVNRVLRMRQIISNNEEHIAFLKKTNGQLLFHADSLVDDGQIQRAMPKERKLIQEDGAKDEFIEKFIELAYEQDIPVVFFFMPIISQRYEKMKELGWFDYVEERFSIYQTKYKNFYYYDALDISYDKKYFGDWSHLNRAGAEKFNREFSAHFIKILGKLGLGHK